MAALRKIATYHCTALVGSNKTGSLKPDEDGYYTLCIGALNAFNNTGAFYPGERAKALFEESGSLMRRIRNGNCKGETGHPKKLPGQSMQEYLQRILQIEETRVCCHFKDIWLQEDMKDGDGRTIIGIIAKVKPSGPMGHALKESIENPHENVCFSIRSLTHDTASPAGYLQKELRNIITFDLVTEPGLSGSVKWNSPALESMINDIITYDDIKSMEDYRLSSPLGLESSQQLFEEVLSTFESLPEEPSKPKKEKPLSFYW